MGFIELARIIGRLYMRSWFKVWLQLPENGFGFHKNENDSEARSGL
jgi:hypothetical protein